MILPSATRKTRTFAWVNWTIIAANCILFSWYWFIPERREAVFNIYAMVPDH